MELGIEKAVRAAGKNIEKARRLGSGALYFGALAAQGIWEEGVASVRTWGGDLVDTFSRPQRATELSSSQIRSERELASLIDDLHDRLQYKESFREQARKAFEEALRILHTPEENRTEEDMYGLKGMHYIAENHPVVLESITAFPPYDRQLLLDLLVPQVQPEQH